MDTFEVLFYLDFLDLKLDATNSQSDINFRKSICTSYKLLLNVVQEVG